MKAERQQTIDDLINITTKSDLFSKAETNPIQWLHWLDILDQQTSNQGLSTSTLDSVLDFKVSRQQETLRFEPKSGKSSATKDSLDSSVKSGNMFGRGLQSSGDKCQPLKFPEAMVAIAQAAKDLPGWPLMSNKMQMHKCEKCSQEFCSTLNQRRHMRATHRRPLNGDKEDLKKKREQIAAFWDKLEAETACEIVSAKNLSLMDLSAASVVRALTTHLQQPSLLLLPQTYIKVATSLLDLVQNKSLKVPVKSAELFMILDDASEKNLLCGVTSSSMHRCIFDSEPAQVGLETKNLVAALGFLVEYRLVRAWMDDKDVEALRCQKALVEEEEAAQKKRERLLERKRQRKLRQKEFKDKERKNIESASGLQELKFNLFPREGEDSLTATQSSPSSSGCSGLDSHTIETSQMTNGDFECQNNCKSPTNHLEDGQSFGDPDDLGETHSESFSYTDSQILESQGDPMERMPRPSTGSVVDARVGWKDQTQGDFSYFPVQGKQLYGKDKRQYDSQYGNQRLTRNLTFEFPSPRYSHYREKLAAFKRPAPVSGGGYAIWTRKTPQAPAAVSQHTENVEGNGTEVVDVSRVLGQSENSETGDKSGSATSRRPEGLSRVSSLSSDSATSHSSGSISARVGAEEQENTADSTVSISVPGQITSAEADFAERGELVIGSVTIPLGDVTSSNFTSVKSASSLEEKVSSEINNKGKIALPDKARFNHVAHVGAEDAPHLSHAASLDAGRETSTTPRGITSYQSGGREETTAQLKNMQNKPVVIKVWRPVTPGDRNNTNIASPSAAELEKLCALDIPGEGACVNSSIQLQHVSGSGSVAETSTKTQQDHKTASPGTPSVFEEDGQHSAACGLSPYYSELARFLSQRWQEAISSPDVVYYKYNKADDLDDVPNS